MAQPPHFDISGSIYFITTSLSQKTRSFNEEESKIVEETILDLASRKEIMLYVYVIMPDHIHLLIRPINLDISKTVQLIKGRASRKINKGTFWQKGFFGFAILTDKKFGEKFNYIHYNPVKRGLVEKAEDYKYSSAMEYKIKYGDVFYE
jgi:REP-associated tyrosine transposase